MIGAFFVFLHQPNEACADQHDDHAEHALQCDRFLWRFEHPGLVDEHAAGGETDEVQDDRKAGAEHVLQVDIEHDEASAEDTADPHPPGTPEGRGRGFAVAEETDESEETCADEEVHHGGLDRRVQDRAELSVDRRLDGTERTEGHTEEAGAPEFGLGAHRVRLLLRAAAEGDDDDTGENERSSQDTPERERDYIATEPPEGVDEDAHDDLPEEREHDGLGGAEDGKQQEVPGEDRDAAESAEEHPDREAVELAERQAVAEDEGEDDEEAEPDEEVDAGGPEGRAQRAPQPRVDARLHRHDEAGQDAVQECHGLPPLLL